MKEVIHRLLLFVVWACTALSEVIAYELTQSRNASIIENLIDNYRAFLIPIMVALALSLAVNWIMTGNMHNWAGKIWNNW